MAKVRHRKSVLSIRITDITTNITDYAFLCPILFTSLLQSSGELGEDTVYRLDFTTLITEQQIKVLRIRLFILIFVPKDKDI